MRAPVSCRVWLLLGLPFVLSGCFVGTVGVVLGILAATDKDSSESADVPRVVNLRVDPGLNSSRADDLTRVSIRFDLVETSNESAVVRVEFLAAGSTGVIEERERITSAAGAEQTLEWNAVDSGLEGFLEVELRVTVRDTNGKGFGAQRSFEIGNDPPRVNNVTLCEGASSLSQNVVVEFDLSDSAGDPSAVDFQVWVDGESVEVDPKDVLSELEEKLPPGHRRLTWASHETLGRTDRDDVVVSIVASDGLWQGDGEAAFSAPCNVDNNTPPTVNLNGAAFATGPDRRRGIPVPFSVDDAEADDVLTVFQYSRASQSSFPGLPQDRATMELYLQDPEMRERLQIATAIPRTFSGRLLPLTDRSLRLPELASTAAALLAQALAGREIDILRASTVPEPVRWNGDLTHPVSAVPLGDGTTALVLERSTVGAWRLREVALATGEEKRSIASPTRGAAGVGSPTALAIESEGQHALVALELNRIWWLVRVELERGEWSVVANVRAAADLGTVRDIEIVGQGAALITVSDALIRIDYSDPDSPIVNAVLRGLATPWGVVLDPLHRSRVYVAERDWQGPDTVGRIIALELDTLNLLPLPMVGAGFPRPEDLALENGGARLLAVTDAGNDGVRELRGMALGVAEHQVFEIASDLGTAVGSIETGPDGLRLLSLPAADTLAIGGGLEQRSVIRQVFPRAQVILLDELNPPARISSRWRIASGRNSFQPQGDTFRSAGVFVWDTNDVPQGGEVLLQATPYDSDRGVPNDSGRPGLVLSPLEVVPLLLDTNTNPPETNPPLALVAADLDGNGALDLAVATRRDLLVVYLQRRPGEFGPFALPAPSGQCPRRSQDGTLGDPTQVMTPKGVAVADLDGDGMPDLVSANEGGIAGLEGSGLALFFGGFTPETLEREPDRMLGSAETTRSTQSVAAADLDGDGDLDLVAANFEGDNLSIFFQKEPREFGQSGISGVAEPDLCLGSCGGGSGPVQGPLSVAAADLDLDGDLDLVSANRDSDSLAVFLQNSPREFGQRTDSGQWEPDFLLGDDGVTRRPRAVRIVDVDRDGALDLVVANEGDRDFEGSGLTIFFQEAPGTFGPLVIENAELLGFPAAVATGDLDGDGNLDLVSTSLEGNTLAVLYQKGAREFGLPGGAGMTVPDLLLGGPGITTRPRDVVLADLDGDGDLDIASANESDASVALFLQVSPGVFGEAACPGHGQTAPNQQLGNEATTRGPVAVAVADLNRDGSLDLVTANLEARSLTLFHQTTPRDFVRQPFLEGEDESFAPRSVVAADIDGDTDPDLLVANAGGSNVTIFRQGAAGDFDIFTVGGPDTTDGPVAVAAGDLDGDGDLDLISANALGDNLTIWCQAGPDQFGIASGDGGPNIVLGGPGRTTKPMAVAVADLDGDGVLDIVAANQGEPNQELTQFPGAGLSLFYQEAPGDFCPAEPGSRTADLTLGDTTITPGPTDVLPADLDGDGDLDLVSVNIGGSLTIFLQEAPRSFAGAVVHPGLDAPLGNTGPVSVAAADLDGDDWLDLVSANSIGDENFGSNLTAFLGRGAGRFGAEPDLTFGGGGTTRAPVEVVAIDLDGDGDIDIVSVNEGSDDVAVFYGGEE